jgi:hypothetical protein
MLQGYHKFTQKHRGHSDEKNISPLCVLCLYDKTFSAKERQLACGGRGHFQQPLMLGDPHA